MCLAILQECLPLRHLVVNISVQHIMLREEDQVVKHRHLTQRKLDRVARHPAPVALHGAINQQLRNTQHAARKVQQDLPDGPPDRALVPEVGHHLRRVLDKRDEQFDVAHRVHGVQPAPVCRGVDCFRGRRRRDQDEHDSHAGDASGSHAQDEPTRPVADRVCETPRAREKILRRGNQRKEEGVRGEDNVVEGDGGAVAPVAGGVLFADDRAIIKGGVGDAVGQETQAVDQREIDSGARGGFPLQVEQRLWVEGERPASRVDPAEEDRQEAEKAENHFGLCYAIFAAGVRSKRNGTH